MTIAAFAAWAIVVAVLGGILTEIDTWYRSLRKPSWQPPDWLFGPAWSVIFTAAAGAGVLAWWAAGSNEPERTRIIVLYAINGVLNAAWSPLFFKFRRPDWALIEVIPLWLSVLAMIVGLAPIAPVAGWLLLPYLVWVAFASMLNLAIVRLNPAPIRVSSASRPRETTSQKST